MPFISYEVRQGDPSIQPNGEHRGSVDAVFDDGTPASQQVRSKDAAGWDAAVASAGPLMENAKTRDDAYEAVDPDDPVDQNGYATEEETCIAYIRSAWAERWSYDAGRLYNQINNYVVNNGGWAAMKQRLLDAGLPEEEYDQAKNAAQYLLDPAQADVLTQADPIQNTWELQHGG